MEPNESSILSAYTPKPKPGFFGTAIPSGVTFAVGILLFLLPFAQIKCNNQTLAENTGLGIALKKEWKTFASDFTDAKQNKKSTDEPAMNKSSYYAIAALVLGVIGLVLAVTNKRAAASIAIATGILASAALIGMMLQLKKIDLNSMNDKPANNDFNFNMKISMDFTPWFYIAVVAFLAAAAFCYVRLRTKPSS